jgi:hypothetical protein
VKNPALALLFSIEKVERAMTPNEVFLGIKWTLKIPNDTFLAKKRRWFMNKILINQYVTLIF